MIRLKTGDITKLTDVEVIVNAANGRGPMGKGVAGAISGAGGPDLRNEVRRICESSGGFKEGECYISGSGNLKDNNIQKVYHAVTMEYPGGQTSLHIVGEAMRNTLRKAIDNGIKSIAFPGLGTGIGGLSKKQVAERMAKIAESFSDKIDITIVDMDGSFTGFVKEFLQTENIKTE